MSKTEESKKRLFGSVLVTAPQNCYKISILSICLYLLCFWHRKLYT